MVLVSDKLENYTLQGIISNNFQLTFMFKNTFLKKEIGIPDHLTCLLRNLRSNQSILKENSPEYSLEGQIQRLKLQYFGHLIRRNHSFEKTLMLGKIEGGKRKGRQRMRWLASPTSMDMGLSKLWELVIDWESWHTTVHRLAKSWTQLTA